MGKNWGIIIIFISITFVTVVVFQNRKLYTEKFDPVSFQNKYNQSQWVIPNSKHIISDEDLYTYAGYKYINGLNPILINPETPPLGKYLIGLSIVLFKNHRIISLISALLSLAIINHIVFLSTNSFLTSSIAVFLTSINTLFIDQIIHTPQLDIFQLLFFLLFIIFFLIFKMKNNIFFLLFAGFAMGFFISTKFFLASFFIFNAWLLLNYLIGKTHLKKIIFESALLNLIALFTYSYTYIGYFILGGNLRSFLGVQKWIYLFYSNTSIEISKLLGNYLSLIFFNQWKFWSEGYPFIHYKYWTIFWPVVFIVGSFSIYKLFTEKKAKEKKLLILLAAFLIIYNLFLFVTPVYPRYLLLLFVPLNILIAIYIGKIIQTKLIHD
ncbi:hypothetical protein A2954_07035 [Candidatus Roizmanbacteria bacterium RIFCSPLOWO2_01_FULL_37_12]|uniref:Glycosyltransferase RgtA/B/C/D-like domain-containing protein n=1 Tax=Candidatus Roizmanbacteria bacterium RIFCSPLOWO2_01_FULL_37_12 TaxID=1802056 RepID=A0A1F7IE26_9BACT|nr:MAG: hypothetical protein A3D76_02340 [Candidatus Roizmanbacteria bacterium RIFCSPHIGHO2_02_FULL_37_9b]OGK41607.1 MAG: hypothetical protein A2954_07035 [Candidatus Roizmanbacteria bacterium RIFCSPLOWO2_01_FULL_37_12]